VKAEFPTVSGYEDNRQSLALFLKLAGIAWFKGKIVKPSDGGLPSFFHGPAHPSFDLQHRQLDQAVFDLAERELFTSDTLEFPAVLVQVVEGLALCPERGLNTAPLSDSADGQNKDD
jgi:hypothetical protein